ncbi:uncharacterized protein BDZ99DRAFT_408916 [Mytilinidion resinicola]|uniref:Zn(2)-C6 fungal-type domain-containing protein n=1 Tax=Mytilinidion resinicola TaxID=574789 RepID=A0A6A6Z4I8_9PEZI|nr:uncharacterized protein BDZ99DRAFT_408916 [Mytilinidion resinicola]KAF2815167.1 hypothetical protein BDZ99DRAFT_408916 [Mytilinidion resinicola]
MSTRIETERDSQLRWATNTPRKACEQCQVAKRRCTLERPACSRCVSKSLHCCYSVHSRSSIGHSIHTENVSRRSNSSRPISSTITPDTLGLGTADITGNASSKPPDTQRAHFATLDFTQISLLSTLDSIQIGSRWMETFVPSSNQTPKGLQPFTVQYLSCVLATYPKSMTCPKKYPPIIHRLQVETEQLSLTLATCYQLVRQWYECRSDPRNVAKVTEDVQRETQRLLSEYQSYSQIDFLAAFQAYLIYLMMAFLSPLSNIQIVGHSSLVSLQEMASHASATGLACTAELSQTRPTWETWIVASAKRRTMYASYLFNNLFNVINGVKTYLAEELTGLPLPATKALWDCQERVHWEREYDTYLESWKEGEIQIAELWRSEATGSPERRERVERWVQAADEFGMTIFAVCCHIHGC